MSAGFEVVLRGGLDAARQARHALAAHEPALPETVQVDLALLVTELVTNAVRHGSAAGDSPVRVELARMNGRVRVEVVDPGKDFVDPGTGFKVGAATGRGRLQRRLGALPGRPDRRPLGRLPAPSGTCVWFEMPAGAAP